MPFSPFLASRYLKPKRTFVSIITVISILGVALGVWLLAVVIAVFTGYGERIKDSILGFEPHLVVGAGGIIDNWPEPYEILKEVEGVTSLSPFVTGQVIMEVTNERGTFRKAPMIRGILPPEGDELERMRGKLAQRQDPEFPTDLEKTVPRGDFDVNGFYSAVVGDGLAEAHGIEVGDTILLYSTADVTRLLDSLDRAEDSDSETKRKEGLNEIREMTAPQEVTVTGIFDSGHWDFDSNIVFVHLETAQVLYNFDLDQCHGIGVRTVDGFRANEFQKTFHELLPEKYQAVTWSEMNKLIFDAVAAERQAMYLILFMIMIVGGFTIMNTMITVTFQKRSEIGLLKALGAREGQIAWVFLFQGVLVGVVGVVVGLLMAEFTLHFRNHMAGWIGSTFGVDIFSEAIYKVDGGLPAKKTPEDFAIISIGAFLACTFASLIPAMIAAKMQPAKALRSE
ncbi:MAG: ABC transporter permease [Verrucomicrobiales bacterium]|nr:ABC transporter permease [Verrucomicrobiales bacterium]